MINRTTGQWKLPVGKDRYLEKGQIPFGFSGSIVPTARTTHICGSCWKPCCGEKLDTEWKRCVLKGGTSPVP